MIPGKIMTITNHHGADLGGLHCDSMQHGKTRGQGLASRPDNHFGRVAKQADASDLKSGSTKVECGFEPRLGHLLRSIATRGTPPKYNLSTTNLIRWLF